MSSLVVDDRTPNCVASPERPTPDDEFVTIRDVEVLRSRAYVIRQHVAALACPRAVAVDGNRMRREIGGRANRRGAHPQRLRSMQRKFFLTRRWPARWNERNTQEIL